MSLNGPIVKTTVTTNNKSDSPNQSRSYGGSTSSSSPSSYNNSSSTYNQSSSTNERSYASRAGSPKSVRSKDFPLSQPSNDEKIKELLAKSLSEREQERLKYENIIKQLELEIEKLNKDYETLKNEYNQHLKEIELRISKAEETQRSLAQQLEESKRNAALEAERNAKAEAALKAQLDDALEEIRRLKAGSKEQEMKAEIERLKDEINRLKAENAQLKNAKADADRALADKDRQIADLTRERDDLKNKLANRDREVTTLQTEKTRLEDELNRERRAREAAEAKLRDWEREQLPRIQSLEREIQRLKDAAAQALRDKEKEIADRERPLKARIADLENELGATKRGLGDIPKLKADLEAARKQNADLQAALDRALKELNDLKEKIAKDKEKRPKVINVTSQIILEPDEEDKEELSTSQQQALNTSADASLRTPNTSTRSYDPNSANASPLVYVTSSPEKTGFVVNTVVQLPENKDARGPSTPTSSRGFTGSPTSSSSAIPRPLYSPYSSTSSKSKK